jgi:FMN reductase
MIAAVVGSVTPPGRLRRSVAETLERSSAASTLIDLAEHPLPFAGAADLATDARAWPPGPYPKPNEPEGRGSAALEAIKAADAVLLATPVYRGTYTGALKNLLDLLPVEALQGKAVAIVAMGASDHHHLGADWHLRDVLAWFGAVALPTSVYLTSRDFEDGAPSEPAAHVLDELLTGLVALAGALPLQLGPPPLAARIPTRQGA